MKSTKERFLNKVIKLENNCWDWDSTYRGANGYPMFYWGIVNGKEKNMKASRASFILNKGEIPAGMHVCHSCDNRSCVNPDHLWLGTHQDNMDDRHKKGRTNAWASRYNFKRSDELLNSIKKLRSNGMKIKDIIIELNIGLTTYYRCAEMGATSIRPNKRRL